MPWPARAAREDATKPVVSKLRMIQKQYFDIRNERAAEEAMPRMSYGALVDSLGRLTQLGVLAEGTPSTMLAVARLVDRGRIERSGLSPAQLRLALEHYRGSA